MRLHFDIKGCEITMCIWYSKKQWALKLLQGVFNWLWNSLSVILVSLCDLHKQMRPTLIGYFCIVILNACHRQIRRIYGTQTGSLFTFSQAKFGSEWYVSQLKGDCPLENLFLTSYFVVMADTGARYNRWKDYFYWEWCVDVERFHMYSVWCVLFYITAIQKKA